MAAPKGNKYPVKDGKECNDNLHVKLPKGDKERWMKAAHASGTNRNRAIIHVMNDWASRILKTEKQDE